MSTKTSGYFTPVRIVFWLIMLSVLSVLVFIVTKVLVQGPYHRNADKPYCVMNQRMLQQLARSHQYQNNLKPGDPLDWSKLIGPGLMTENKPACPVHGEYFFSSVIPETGTLAVPCKDPAHHPGDIHDW